MYYSPWVNFCVKWNFVKFIYFCMYFQHHLLKRLFCVLIFFCTFVKKSIGHTYINLFLSPFIFHWSMFPSICQDHVILITVDLYYVLKSDNFISQTLFLLYKIDLAPLLSIKFDNPLTKNKKNNFYVVEITLNLEINCHLSCCFIQSMNTVYLPKYLVF